MEDGTFSEQMEDAEHTLLEAYAAGTLPEDQKPLVRDWIAASPRLTQHVEITRALQSHGIHAAKSRGSAAWFLWVTAAACAVIIAAVSVIWVRHKSSPPQQNIAGISRPTGIEMPKSAPTNFNGDTILLRPERLRATSPANTAIYEVHADEPLRLQILVGSHSAKERYSLDISPLKHPGIYLLSRQDLEVTTSGTISYVEALVPDSLAPGGYVATLHSTTDVYRVNFSVQYASKRLGP